MEKQDYDGSKNLLHRMIGSSAHAFVSLVTSFCARIYGRRRSERVTEKLIKELSIEEECI